MSLQPLLRRAAACQVVGNLYPLASFAPTKLSVADDPTRDQQMRQSSETALWELVPRDILRKLPEYGLSRPVANWIRLVLLASFARPIPAFSPLDPAFQTSAIGLGFSADPIASGLGLFGFGYGLWTWTLGSVLSLCCMDFHHVDLDFLLWWQRWRWEGY